MVPCPILLVMIFVMNLCFSALPFDSWLCDAGVGTLHTTFFLHQLAPVESHQQETVEETGRQEEEGGTWSFCLFVVVATTRVAPAMALHPRNGNLSQSLTLSLAPPELASSSHIRGTRIIRAESPSLRSEYQLSGVLLSTSEDLNTPTFSLCFLSPKGEKLTCLVLPWIPFCLSVLQHHQTRSLYLIFSAKIMKYFLFS